VTPNSSWPTAADLSSVPLPFAAALARAAALGFTRVEVAALAERPAEHLEALADTGLLVACAALGQGLPPGHALDAADVAVRRATLKQLQLQVADAARLGATCAWLSAGADATEAGRARFTEGCVLLAEQAARRMVRLAVGLGSALPDVERVGHPNLGLMLTLGAADDAALARRAGPRLFHLRRPAKVEGIGELMKALQEVGYRGVVVVPPHPPTPSPTQGGGGAGMG
jgi:sugar phosphate isomerase/epimerase